MYYVLEAEYKNKKTYLDWFHVSTNDRKGDWYSRECPNSPFHSLVKFHSKLHARIFLSSAKKLYHSFDAKNTLQNPMHGIIIYDILNLEMLIKARIIRL